MRLCSFLEEPRPITSPFAESPKPIPSKANASKKGHVITSSIEHSSVRGISEEIQKARLKYAAGYSARLLDVDSVRHAARHRHVVQRLVRDLAAAETDPGWNGRRHPPPGRGQDGGRRWQSVSVQHVRLGPDAIRHARRAAPRSHERARCADHRRPSRVGFGSEQTIVRETIAPNFSDRRDACQPDGAAPRSAAFAAGPRASSFRISLASGRPTRPRRTTTSPSTTA